MATRNDNEQNKAADEAARTARTVTDEAARVGEQTARAGADIANRGTETAREAVQAGLNTATQSFQRINDQFTQALGFNGPQAEELARRSSQNLQAVSQASTVLARGAQEVSKEVFGLVQDRLQKNLDAVNRIAGVRSVQDFVAAQSDLVRDGLQQVIDTNKRIAEVSVRMADEVARILHSQAEVSQVQMREFGSAMEHAARPPGPPSPGPRPKTGGSGPEQS
jgi:phasin family protein